MESLKRMIDKAQARGLSKSELARRLGVSPQKFGDYAAGRVPMPVAKLCALARLTDSDPVNLVGQYMIEKAKKKGLAAPAAGALLAFLALAGGGSERPREAPSFRSQSIHSANRRLVYRHGGALVPC